MADDNEETEENAEGEDNQYGGGSEDIDAVEQTKRREEGEMDSPEDDEEQSELDLPKDDEEQSEMDPMEDEEEDENG